MLVPLYGFVEGDTMGILVLAHHDMTMRQIAELLRDSVRVRVPVAATQWQLHVGDCAVNEALTVADLGLEPLARIDLRQRTS
jgi:hypothetical protein